MDVSKLISTSPLEYQSQKLNYSVLLTELNADLSITLQSIYNASTQPQILTSVAKGGVVIRSGQALDTNSVLELKNIAGSSTFVVGGNGIVATGNWQATAIAAAFGGTGQTSYTIGDIIYASNTTAISKLGIGTSGQVLTVSGGGIPSWATASSSNLGSANLTSADDARTFTLKSGGTATQNLAFLNNGGGNLLQLKGSNIIDFGSTTNFIKGNIYTDSSLNDNIVIYSGANGWAYWQSNARNMYLYGTSSGIIQLTAQSGKITATGDDGGFRANNASGVSVGTLETEGSGCWFFAANSAGTKKVEFYVPGNEYYLSDGCAFGHAPATRGGIIDVKGAGATSSTTTALFKNSSSVAALKVKDDGYCIIKANNAAIASGDLANNEMSFYIDEATNHCVVKVKYSSGTVKTGTFNLT
jgi:hypothetical protein